MTSHLQCDHVAACVSSQGGDAGNRTPIRCLQSIGNPVIRHPHDIVAESEGIEPPRAVRPQLFSRQCTAPMAATRRSDNPATIREPLAWKASALPIELLSHTWNRNVLTPLRVPRARLQPIGAWVPIAVQSIATTGECGRCRTYDLDVKSILLYH